MAPAVAIHFMGVNGAYLIALIVLLAVTSTLNQELMAVSKLISYDFYRTYRKPNATGTQILKVTRVTMIVFGLLMGVFAILLTRVGVTLEFVYYFMGIAIGGAVPPIYFCVNWNKASSKGAISGAIAGSFCGLASWIIAAAVKYGEVTLDTLGNSNNDSNMPFLVGNVASLAVSAVVCTAISLRTPQNYEWDTMQALELNTDEHMDLTIPARLGQGAATVVKFHFNSSSDRYKRTVTNRPQTFTGRDSIEALQSQVQKVQYVSWSVIATVLVVIPLLVLPAKVFSEGYFSFWCFLSLVMVICATSVAIFLPLMSSPLVREFARQVIKLVKSIMQTKKRQEVPPVELSRANVHVQPTALWSWQSDDGSSLLNFPLEVCSQLEEALTGGCFQLELHDKNMKFDLAAMTQTNVLTNSVVKIQRSMHGRATKTFSAE